jgi:4-amino-4-deoxy-L-arabinose transferase
MWFGFGLAFMTKGPPGLLALIPVVVFTLLRIDRRRIGQVFTPVGMLAFTVVSLAWYVAAIARHPDLLRYWLYHEVAGRVGSNEYRNSEWYYAFVVYVPTLLVGTAPWFKPAWRILAGARQMGSRPGHSQLPAPWRARARWPDAGVFTACWRRGAWRCWA